MRGLRVAAFQKRSLSRDVPETARRVLSDLKWCDEQGVQLAVFPECYLQGYALDRQTLEDCAIALDGPEARALLEILRPTQATCVLGLVERQGHSIFNSAVAIRRGGIVGRYRKSRLHRKEAAFEAGTEAFSFEVGGWPIGINICHEANFPEMAIALARREVKLICYPLNNMLPRDVAERWRSKSAQNIRERAIDTGCWVISADVVGESDEMLCYGCTGIVSPSGDEVGRVAEGTEGVAVFDLLS